MFEGMSSSQFVVHCSRCRHRYLVQISCVLALSRLGACAIKMEIVCALAAHVSGFSFDSFQ